MEILTSCSKDLWTCGQFLGSKIVMCATKFWLQHFGSGLFIQRFAAQQPNVTHAFLGTFLTPNASAFQNFKSWIWTKTPSVVPWNWPASMLTQHNRPLAQLNTRFWPGSWRKTKFNRFFLGIEKTTHWDFFQRGKTVCCFVGPKFGPRSFGTLAAETELRHFLKLARHKVSGGTCATEVSHFHW